MAKDKEKGNLTGFLFGNVKESGELDVEENDQVFKDLKGELELFAKSGGQHVSFKKTIGIDEDDKNAVLDQAIVPSKDALDYEDINEQAEEIQSAEYDINRQNSDALAKAAIARILQQHQERERQRIREEEERRQREEEQRLSKLSRKERKLQKKQARLQRKQEQSQQQPQTSISAKKNYDDFDFDEDEEPTSTQRPAIQSSMTESSSGEEDDDSDTSRSSISSRSSDDSFSPRSSDDSDSDSNDSDSDISDSDGDRTGRHYRRRRKGKKPKKKVTIKAGSYEVVKSLLETPEMFTPEDPEFKLFVSGKTNDGFILKFSQLFAPKFPEKPVKRRSRRLKFQTIQPIKEESIEQDETLIWNQPSKKQPPPSSISNIRKPIVETDSITKQLLKSNSGSGSMDDSLISSNSTTPTLKSMSLFQQQQQAADEEDEYVPEPLQETKDQEMFQIFYQVPDSNYHSLQQVDWEDNIIWDEECLTKLEKGNQNNLFLESQSNPPATIKDTNTSNNNNNRSNNNVTNRTNSTTAIPLKLNKTAKTTNNKNKLFGLDHDSEKEEINMEIDNQLPQQIASTTTTTTTTQPNEENNEIGGEKPKDQDDVDTVKSKIDRWSLFSIPNQELEKGDWIDNIIWDESMVPEKLKQVSMLILDLNDRDMYFEEHIERKENNTDPIHGIAGGVSAADQPPVKKKSKKRMALEAAQAAKAAELAKSQAAAAAANGQTMSFEEQLQRDKEEQERKEREEREQSQREIDKFNLSNDKYYIPVRKRQVRPQSGTGKALVQHSLPGTKLSLVKTHLTKEDLIYAHRPRIQFPAYSPFRIILYNKDGNAIGTGDLNSSSNNLSNSSSSIRNSAGGIGLNQSSSSVSNALTQPTKKSLHKSDLSGRDGRIVLIEYTEQNPPLLSNVGMGMRIRNFYKKKSPHEAAPKDLGFEDGETVVLDNTEESPFLGDVLPGQAVQQLVSNLYKAPLFKHQSNPNDFLLVRSRDGKRWYVRDVGPIYAAGQQLPEIEVPAPNSRSANMFLKSRLQAYIYRMFLKKSNQQRRLKIADICLAFPSQSETSIRKRLKDCADFQRGGDDSGWWTVKDNFPLPTEDELQKLVTPEVVCAYESMQVGLQRLQDNGIIHFTAPGTIPTILGSLDDEDPIKKSYRPVEEELQITPWNLTSSYLTAMQGKGRLQIISEDTTARVDEFCFLKMPQKVVNQKQKAIKQAQAKNQVTGTDADLRKLSLSASKTVLLELGVDEAVIDRLTRWQRIDLVRKKSSEAALASDPNAAMTKFARGSRYSVDHQNLQYKEQCQLVFENQMKALSGKGDDGYDEEMDPDLKDLDDDLFGGSTPATNNANPTGTTKSTGKRGRSLFRDDDEDDLDDDNEQEAFRELFEKDPNPSAPKLTEKEKEADEARIKEEEEAAAARAKAKAEAEDLTRGDRVFVKRTTLFQKPDGSLFKRIEIIRDPQSVTEYQKKKPEQYQMDRKKFGKHNHEDDDETKRKKARRLEEKISKLKGSTSGGSSYNMMNMSNNSMNTSTSSIGSMGGGTIGSSNIVNISAGNIQVNKSNNIRISNDFDYNNSGGRNINNNGRDQSTSSKQRQSLPSNNSNNNFNQGSDNNNSGRVRDSSSGRSDRDRDRDRDRDGHRRDRDSSRGDGRSDGRSERHHRDSSRGDGHHSRSEHSSSHHRDHHRDGHHSRSERSERSERSDRDRERSERDGHKPSRNSTGGRSDRERDREHGSYTHHRNSTGNINNDRMDISNNNNNDINNNNSSNNNITTQPSQSGIIIRFNNSSNSVNNKQSQQQSQQNIINVDDITNTPLSTASTGSTNRKKRTLDQSNSESPSLAGNSTDEKSRRNRVRKDGSGANVELSNIFETVLDKLRSTEEFTAFKTKVTSKIAPDYPKIIKNPIDLTTMRDRNRHPNWEYKSKAQFMDAIQLMVDNCYLYNQSRYINLLPIVDRLMAAAISYLTPYEATIAELEKSIEQSNLKQSSSSLLSASTNSHHNIVSSGGEILQPLQLQSTSSNHGGSTPATPISIAAQNTPTLSTNSPFFPPVDQQPKNHHSAEDEEIDILSLYESGVSPSVKNNQ